MSDETGPFTVFSPTNETFNKIPAETLENLLTPENEAQLQAALTCQVVSGNMDAVPAMSLSEAKAVQGEVININMNDNKVMINNASVIAAAIGAHNGVIHVTDTVLLPPSVMKTFVSFPINQKSPHGLFGFIKF